MKKPVLDSMEPAQPFSALLVLYMNPCETKQKEILWQLQVIDWLLKLIWNQKLFEEERTSYQ